MISLVGYTGFVGSNIYEGGRGYIENVYNSKNIKEAYGTNPDLLIYSGMRAEKYIANTNSDADMQLVYEAQDNIGQISPKNVVLISTIDVLKDPTGKDEDSDIDIENLHAYGLNRYWLEQWTRSNYPDALIIRLPGLYGKNIKKNFIYDYINVIPFMLNKEKFVELSEKAPILNDYYDLQDNGFYKCNCILEDDKDLLRETFRKLGFTALNFTDSRNVYQFYPLSRMWNDIQTALNAGIRLWHPATEPVSAGELYMHLSGKAFENFILDKPLYYDYKTKYSAVFNGDDGYIMNKRQVLEDIKKFVGGSIS